MTRQGPERAIGRLHPEFVKRLAAAIAEARGAGLPFARIFSAYRPPVLGVGASPTNSIRSIPAKQRDELAAPHVWMAPAWQEITSRAAQKSLAVMCPACSRSPDGLLALMESALRLEGLGKDRNGPVLNGECGVRDTCRVAFPFGADADQSYKNDQCDVALANDPVAGP